MLTSTTRLTLKLVFFFPGAFNHPECIDTHVVSQPVAKQGRGDLLFFPAATCSLAAASIPSSPPPTPSREGAEDYKQDTTKTTLTAGSNTEARSTASSCAVPIGLLTDICKCLLTHGHTLTVRCKKQTYVQDA